MQRYQLVRVCLASGIFFEYCLIKRFESNASLIDLSFLQVNTIGLINQSLLHDSFFFNVLLGN